jgi:dUTP pyrophosphatase
MADSRFLVHKADPRAQVPTIATNGSVGYDLYALEGEIIGPRSHGVIRTGIHIKVPDGHYGRIAPRSGYAARRGIDVLAGVIDPDYQGEIRVIISNPSQYRFTVDPGQRIAQLILEKCSVLPVIDVSSDEFTRAFRDDPSLSGGTDENVRGEGGFGSTGTHSV